jgi:hypothetical protein
VKLISLIVEQNIKYRQYLLKYFDLKPVWIAKHWSKIAIQFW